MDKTWISNIWRRISWDKLVAYPKKLSEFFCAVARLFFRNFRNSKSKLEIKTRNRNSKLDLYVSTVQILCHLILKNGYFFAEQMA